jgi:ABC-type multidrug transport system ATPase subunit
MEIKQLSFQHDKNAPLFFKELSFSLEMGKIHALHGKNGIGKSVLLNILSNKKNSQSIIKGEIIGMKNCVLVNQRFDHMIADQFSFLDNMKFACMSRFPRLFSHLKEPEGFFDLLEKFHIDYSTPAYKLSGGQRQILALLMVLQKKTDCLLLDEPTAAMDEQNAELFFDFLKSLVSDKITALVICHDRELMDRYTTGSKLCLELDHFGLRKLKIG